MSPRPSTDGPAGRPAPFACHWRLEGRSAASVRVSGELDLATAGRLERALAQSARYARLVLLDVSAMSFMDLSGLHVIVDASARARGGGARVVLTGASEQVEALLEVMGTRARPDVLRPSAEVGTRAAGRRAEHRSIRPLDNPVNASVVSARVAAFSDAQLWVHAVNGTIHRPWAPPAEQLGLATGAQIEVYLDATGAVNGWRDPRSGFAVNQRGLDAGAAPTTYADLACRGSCGIVWHAPAAARLAQRAERCLTCAGPLVLE